MSNAAPMGASPHSVCVSAVRRAVWSRGALLPGVAPVHGRSQKPAGYLRAALHSLPGLRPLHAMHSCRQPCRSSASKLLGFCTGCSQCMYKGALQMLPWGCAP